MVRCLHEVVHDRARYMTSCCTAHDTAYKMLPQGLLKQGNTIRLGQSTISTILVNRVDSNKSTYVEGHINENASLHRIWQHSCAECDSGVHDPLTKQAAVSMKSPERSW